MKKIVNKIIPFGSYKCMAVWPILFIREGKSFGIIDETHENIHGIQQKELLKVAALIAVFLLPFVGLQCLFILPLFYYLYVFFFLVELLRCAMDKERGNGFAANRNLWSRAYHMVPFELEAYDNDDNRLYLYTRPSWAWVYYLR